MYMWLFPVCCFASEWLRLSGMTLPLASPPLSFFFCFLVASLLPLSVTVFVFVALASFVVAVVDAPPPCSPFCRFILCSLRLPCVPFLSVAFCGSSLRFVLVLFRLCWPLLGSPVFLTGFFLFFLPPCVRPSVLFVGLVAAPPPVRLSAPPCLW